MFKSTTTLLTLTISLLPFVAVYHSQDASPAHSHSAETPIGQDTTLADGLSYTSSSLISKALFDAEADTMVRVLTFDLEIGGSAGTAFSMTQLEYPLPTSNKAFEYSFGGIIPEFGAGPEAKDAPAHSYLLLVEPAKSKTWGTVTGDGDVQFTLVRTQ